MRRVDNGEKIRRAGCDANHEPECGECGKKTWQIIEIGEFPDSESATAYLCADCLRAALHLLGEAQP